MLLLPSTLSTSMQPGHLLAGGNLYSNCMLIKFLCVMPSWASRENFETRDSCPSIVSRNTTALQPTSFWSGHRNRSECIAIIGQNIGIGVFSEYPLTKVTASYDPEHPSNYSAATFHIFGGEAKQAHVHTYRGNSFGGRQAHRA